jgi:hypothetical protein
MSDATFQTVRIRRGAHTSPEDGACVVELASMLAGERFSDHPRCVCPVIAGFLRVYNDRLPEWQLGQLYPLAPMVVGSASSRAVRRRRRQRLAAWTQAQDPRRAVGRFALREDVVVGAGHAAAALDPRERRAAVQSLVAELVAMGTGRSPVPSVPSPAEGAAAAATTSG